MADRLLRLAAVEPRGAAADGRHDEERTSPSEPRVPEDKAPVSFQRPNARPQPADVHGEKYFQGNTSDGESDTDNGHEHGRGVAPALGYSRALCDGDDPDTDGEAHGDAEEAEDDEACRAAFGKVIAS